MSSVNAWDGIRLSLGVSSMNQSDPPAECSCVFQRLKLYSHVSPYPGSSPAGSKLAGRLPREGAPEQGLSQSLVLQFRFASNSTFIILLRSLQRAGLSGTCPTSRPKIGSYERLQNPASKLPVAPPLEWPRAAKAWLRRGSTLPLRPTPPNHSCACAHVTGYDPGWKRRCAWRPSTSQWTIATEDFKCGGDSCILPGGAGGQSSSRCCQRLWAAVSGSERLWAAEVRGGTGGEHRGYPTGLGLFSWRECAPRIWQDFCSSTHLVRR